MLICESGDRRRGLHAPGHRTRAPDRLDDPTRGERCQIVVPPAVPAGTISLTIRKASGLAMTLDEFERRDLFRDVRASTDDLPREEQDLLRLARRRPVAGLPGARGAREAQHHHLGRDGLWQDHARQGLGGVHSGARAHPHHRGHAGAHGLRTAQSRAPALRQGRAWRRQDRPARALGIVVAHASRPDPAPGAQGRHRLLLSAQRQLRPPGLDHDRPRRTRRASPSSSCLFS